MPNAFLSLSHFVTSAYNPMSCFSVFFLPNQKHCYTPTPLFTTVFKAMPGKPQGSHPLIVGPRVKVWGVPRTPGSFPNSSATDSSVGNLQILFEIFELQRWVTVKVAPIATQTWCVRKPTNLNQPIRNSFRPHKTGLPGDGNSKVGSPQCMAEGQFFSEGWV